MMLKNDKEVLDKIWDGKEIERQLNISQKKLDTNSDSPSR
jgi:hypothetical protein